MYVRLIFSFLTVAALAGAQAPPAAAPSASLPSTASPVAASPNAASTVAPRIGMIDFYGLNKVPEDRLRKTLGFQDGDPFPRSKADVEEHLDTLPGVVESHLEAVC